MLKRYILPLALMAATVTPAIAADGSNELKAQHARGEKLFGRYCSRCHGEKADGEGRMVKRLYRKKGTQLPTNFTIRLYAERTDEYLDKIITEGGESHSMSKYMPPFGQELSDNDVSDLIVFVKNVSVLNTTPDSPATNP